MLRASERHESNERPLDFESPPSSRAAEGLGRWTEREKEEEGEEEEGDDNDDEYDGSG